MASRAHRGAAEGDTGRYRQLPSASLVSIAIECYDMNRVQQAEVEHVIYL